MAEVTDEAVKLLRALLALAVDERDERVGPPAGGTEDRADPRRGGTRFR